MAQGNPNGFMNVMRFATWHWRDARWLSACIALVEDLHSFPSIHVEQLTVNSSC